MSYLPLFLWCVLFTAHNFPLITCSTSSSTICSQSDSNAAKWTEDRKPITDGLYCPKYYTSITDALGKCRHRPDTLNVSFDLPVHYKPFNMKTFLDILKKHDVSITLVGDSLTGQMYIALRCILESDCLENELKSFDEHVTFDRSLFLSQMDAPYYVQVGDDFKSHIYHEDWFTNVDKWNRKINIIIFNTGPWWVPERIHKQPANTSIPIEELDAAFAHHFLPTGRLSSLLSTLNKHPGRTVIPVWRDISPAGHCSDDGKVVISRFEFYYSHFYDMNLMARSFVIKNGGYVLPHIWNASVPHSKQHYYGKHTDVLHWCNYAPSSVPWMWATVLYNSLPEILLKAGVKIHV